MKKTIIIPRTQPPKLRFSPTAWAKLLYLRDAGDTEIGGFGIARRDDLLFVEDVELVVQRCRWWTVTFDDESVAEFFDRQAAAGRRPEEFARIWIHTHPGSSPDPSLTDEATLARVFGRSDWAVMFILARSGATFARLRYNVGPSADVPLSVDIDYRQPFGGADHEAWQAEYERCVKRVPGTSHRAVHTSRSLNGLVLDDWRQRTWDANAEFEQHSLQEQFDYVGYI